MADQAERGGDPARLGVARPFEGARLSVDHEVREAVVLVQVQRADEGERVERVLRGQASIGAAEPEDELQFGRVSDPQQRADGGYAGARLDPRERGL